MRSLKIPRKPVDVILFIAPISVSKIEAKIILSANAFSAKRRRRRLSNIHFISKITKQASLFFI